MADHPRVNDGGGKIVDVDAASVRGKPKAPAAPGNGRIFVSVVSYRDGERCGDTLKSLFSNAKNADNVAVGLVEQNDAPDKFCLEQYCAEYGLETLQRRTVRKDFTKIMAHPAERAKCPHHDQVRHVAFYHVNAKGPIKARAMARKSLGNEEFCLQIDAHTEFASNWDEILLEEWHKIGNEFGVLTTVPPATNDKTLYQPGGDKDYIVPRQCRIKFRENKFPDYESPADGTAEWLKEPLLSHGYSGAFLFSKCHLEETVPHDPFLEYALPIEQFSRYARMWTRGYDTYTPTRNVIFHNYNPQTNGHGHNEWFKRQRDRFRKGSIARVQTALQLEGGEETEAAQANLGLYGLGQRRSIDALWEFTNMVPLTLTGNVGSELKCTPNDWVPYNMNVSPTANLFDNPDNLDPQPEFPLRTEMVFYKQVEKELPDVDLTVDMGDGANSADAVVASPQQQQAQLRKSTATQKPELPSFLLLFVFWIFGLLAWCGYFLLRPSSAASSGRKRVRRKKSDQSKEV